MMMMVVVVLVLLAGVGVEATSLGSFGSCASVREYFVGNAEKRVTAYGLTDQVYFRRREQLLTLASAPQNDGAGNGNGNAPPQEGTDFSGTNVQVSGVDEPDVVKTDGRRVLALRGKRLYIATVLKDGATGAVTGNLTLPLYASNMLFYGDDALLIASDYEYPPATRFPRQPVSRLQHPQPRDAAARLSLIFRPFFGKPVTVLYRVSLSGSRPYIAETLRVDGSYISARAVDGVVRLVLSYDASTTSSLPFVTPDGKKRTSEQAILQNKFIVRRSTLSDWLPQYSANGTYCSSSSRSSSSRRSISSSCRRYRVSNRPLVASCNDVYYPRGEFSGFGVLIVATVRLGGPLSRPGATAVVADGSTVYATANTLYVGTTAYQRDFVNADAVAIGSAFKTSFHKFALLPAGARYFASGAVSGSVLNQFSMHEYDGTFFIATTDGAPWWGARDTSVSKVSAFREARGSAGSSRRLEKVGEVGNLGVGERIYAVRYVAAVAYVVTFRQVDPLYIIDLSAPTRLRVTGELKIPGFSTYLHPLSGGRVLGVGRAATAEGRTTGAKVSLFDVSDVSDPKELSSWTLDGAYSSAEWDHRAFLYWPPENIAVLPVSLYASNDADRFTGSIVLRVTDAAVSEQGRITHSCCGSQWQRAIERNFVIGRVHLWSLSSEALQVNDIKSLKQENVISLT